MRLLFFSIVGEEKIRNTGRGSSGRIPFYGKPPKQTVYLYHELGRIARDFLADRGDFLGCCYFASFSGPTGGNGWRKCRNAKGTIPTATAQRFSRRLRAYSRSPGAPNGGVFFRPARQKISEPFGHVCFAEYLLYCKIFSRR